MEKSPKVSILTPIYNNGGIVHRLLDSVLSQSYPNIEMIVIDDGSTDNTKAVVESYIDLFSKRGYSLQYIYQHNSGQSVAINNGLKYINGYYLVWPDADDFYSTPTSISTMVSTFEDAGLDVGMVRCEANIVDEDSLLVIGSYELKPNAESISNLFTDCLMQENGYWFLAGGCMTKVSLLDENIENREIYTEKKAGQNWQLMLPIMYNMKCITIQEKLYNVLERKDSHSRSKSKDFNHRMVMYDVYERTILATLLTMKKLPNIDRDMYINKIKEKYLICRLALSLSYLELDRASVIKDELDQNRYNIPIKLRLFYNFPHLFKLLKRVYNKIKLLVMR